MPLVRVLAATPLEGHRVRVSFTTGETREIDLRPYLNGPVFFPVLSDPGFFRQVLVEGGTVAWPNGADIDPDVLYHGGAPAWAQAASGPHLLQPLPA